MMLKKLSSMLKPLSISIKNGQIQGDEEKSDCFILMYITFSLMDAKIYLKSE